MKNTAHYFSIVIATILAITSQRVIASTAAVAMPEHHAALASEQVLREGGNAVDAAVTAAFVLAVTYPEAGNIGGGGFMISYMDGEAAFLDFRERAPAAAHRDMYLDEGGNVIPNASLIGSTAVGVPGTVRGMQAAHARYGSLPWKRLLEPAISLARDGFVVPADLAHYAQEKVLEVDGTTNFADYFGQMQADKNFKQAELATTLERIAEDPDSFYSGVIARQIAAQMLKSDGLITLQDLATYKALWRVPLQSQWRGMTIIAAPPPSSGGLALLQLLTMRDDADNYFRDIWHNSPQYVHLLAELEKRVFADRAEYLGDPDYVDVPVERLLDKDYLRRRAAEINPQAITASDQVEAGLESTDTTHFSILDSRGNAVSLTYTLNWDFGSGEVVEGAGFVLNNEMDDFSAKPGVKNKFGVIGNSRNAIMPGKRMLSSMTPTIILKDKQPALVIGTPGGSTIFTSVFQVILNLYDYSMPLQAAVDATRYHHQLPDARLIRHDQRPIPEQTRLALEKMGYTVEANSWGNLGDITAIYIADGQVQAASDGRGRGEARTIASEPEVVTER